MKKFIPIFIAILTIITITIITIYNRQKKKPWQDMSVNEKRMMIISLSAGILFLIAGILILLNYYA